MRIVKGYKNWFRMKKIPRIRTSKPLDIYSNLISRILLMCGVRQPTYTELSLGNQQSCICRTSGFWVRKHESTLSRSQLICPIKMDKFHHKMYMFVCAYTYLITA